MTRDLERLAGEDFDLLVIGGGITGAFTAWDAALRGLRVALIERSDFGAATSAASSKIIHGGIRHLQKGELQRVRESIVERAIFLRIAPHLVHRLPFLVPAYGHGMRGKEVLALAMTIYDLIGVGQNRDLPPEKRIGRHRVLSRAEALALEPDLPPRGLTGAVCYDEAHMHSSERTTLAVIRAAQEAGAVVANYVEAVELIREGKRVRGAHVRDALDPRGGNGAGSFAIKAHVIANMTGPWAPRWIERVERIEERDRSEGPAERAEPRFGLSKGVHLVTPSLTRSAAVALATHHQTEALVSRGGRHFFIIPWRNHSLIGTTNVSYDGDPVAVGVTEKDIADFLAEINAAYPAAALGRDDVQFFFSGLYPLVDKQVRAGVYQSAGQYDIFDHARDGIDALITVIGPKFTTARKLAERAVDAVFRKLGHAPPAARTAATAVHGGNIDTFADFLAEAIRRDAQGTMSLGPEVVRELVLSYGSYYRKVLDPVEKDPEEGKRVAEDRPVIRASVRYAVREEMALRLSDVIFRRTGLGTIGDPGQSCLKMCAAIMAEELGWDAERTRGEIEAAEVPFRTQA